MIPLAAQITIAILTVGAEARSSSFDPQTDYAYNLNATDAEIFEVELRSDGFDWPKHRVDGESVFLELTVKANGKTKPEIVAKAGGISCRQVFEDNARGKRFVDISTLTKSVQKEPVSLTGHDLTWIPGKIKLYAYRNPSLTKQRVLILAPHPDDAEIAAFGAYRQTGADIITITSGDAGGRNFEELYEDPAEHYRIKGWIRTWDSINVPFYGGVLPGTARNLGFYDARLKAMQADPEKSVAPLSAKLNAPGFYRSFNIDPELRDRPFKANWKSLVSDLAWELNRVRPTVIVAPHPMLDSHSDHQFTTVALIEALASYDQECELYLYTNHGIEDEAFPLGDREARTGLPAWTGGNLFFSRIYVHPLTDDDQRRKTIALEAMHDLRDFNIHTDTTPPTAEELSRRQHYSYFRRAPRPNELFFVVTRQDAFQLREAFLKSIESN